jgi:hypothetical protein
MVLLLLFGSTVVIYMVSLIAARNRDIEAKRRRLEEFVKVAEPSEPSDQFEKFGRS